MPENPVSQLAVEVYDGTRSLLPTDTKILFYLRDGRNNTTSIWSQPVSRFTELPYHDDDSDHYTLIASVNGYRMSGFGPTAVSPSVTPTVRLIMLPNDYVFDFTNASWNKLKQTRTRIWNVLNGSIVLGSKENPVAQTNYENLVVNNQKPTACMLNILTAMDQIQLGGNLTPLDFIVDIYWGAPGDAYSPLQDRFYCWAKRELIDAVLESKNLFSAEPNPSIWHGGTATRSWKEKEFGEANVQLTFHEGVSHPSNSDWIRLEPDIDYYKDLLAHFFGEVVVNWFGSLTDPSQVYCLRWNDGNKPGNHAFDPPYVIRRR